MERKWFQLTLRGLLLATFWMGVWFTSTSIEYQGELATRLLIFGGRTASPFVAIGALYGRPIIGQIIGLLVGAAFATAYMWTMLSVFAP